MGGRHHIERVMRYGVRDTILSKGCQGRYGEHYAERQDWKIRCGKYHIYLVGEWCTTHYTRCAKTE